MISLDVSIWERHPNHMEFQMILEMCSLLQQRCEHIKGNQDSDHSSINGPAEANLGTGWDLLLTHRWDFTEESPEGLVAWLLADVIAFASVFRKYR